LSSFGFFFWRPFLATQVDFFSRPLGGMPQALQKMTISSTEAKQRETDSNPIIPETEARPPHHAQLLNTVITGNIKCQSAALPVANALVQMLSGKETSHNIYTLPCTELRIIV
jgi:hypothetical protein